MSPAVDAHKPGSPTPQLNGHRDRGRDDGDGDGDNSHQDHQHHHQQHHQHHQHDPQGNDNLGRRRHQKTSHHHDLGDETQQQPHPLESPYKRPRTVTSTEEIDSTIFRPGSVKINVKGAFIVDPDSATPPSVGDSAALDRPSPSAHRETSDIRLPNHTAVVSHIAVDIGGSLVKLVYFTREVDSTDPGGRLNFHKFETDRIDDCCEFMKHLRDKQLTLNGSPPGDLCVMATGGGAYKFYDQIRQALGVEVFREDEMECLIIGLDFFISEIPREVFTYSETDPMHFQEPRDSLYPYLLVNIGSGVSFLKVTGPRSYQRVGGTSLGGGTLWGLLSLLTGARSFDDMLSVAEAGDNTKVDMMVGDIYGADYGKIGLKSSAIASSFGKVFRLKLQEEARAAERATQDSRPAEPSSSSSKTSAPSSTSLPLSSSSSSSAAPAAAAATTTTTTTTTTTVSSAQADHDTERPEHPEPTPSSSTQPAHDPEHPEPPSSSSTKPSRDPDHPDHPDPAFSAADISRSLLYAISNNIGQIAYLQSQIHNLSEIYFGGSFIRGHRQTMNTLSYAIKFWSKGEKQAYFLRHEGYLGAVGAFLKRQPVNWGRRGSLEGMEDVQEWRKGHHKEGEAS